MKKLSNLLIIIILGTSLLSCFTTRKSTAKSNPEIKNVILMIGDDIQTHKVKLNFSTKDHTAVMVPVYAYGPGAEKFTGIYDNTDIFQKILTCYGFKQIK